MNPTVSMLIEVKDMPLADLRDILRDRPGVTMPPAVPARQSNNDEVIGLRQELAKAKTAAGELQREVNRLREAWAEQPTWDGEAPKDRTSINILQHAPQDLLNLSAFLEKLDDAQLDTVWVAAVLDALHATIPNPSIRGLTMCLNHVRERYRQRLTGAVVSPIKIGGGAPDSDRTLMDEPGSTIEPRPERAPQVSRAELLDIMLAAVPSIGDRVKSSHFEERFRARVKAIAQVDDRFNWIAGTMPVPGVSPKAAQLERRA